MKKIFCSCFLGVSLAASAQLYPVFSQYYFNELVINPAYAGAHVQLSANATFRNQWVNFPGAPRTFSFSAHSSFAKGKVGIGLMANQDKIGSYSNKDITVSYAYKLKFKESTLSFGISGSLYFISADFSSLILKSPDDANFFPVNQIKPNVGTGVYFSRKNFFAAISAPYLINSKFGLSNAEITSALKQLRFYFVRSGTILPLDPKGDIKINPSILIRAQEQQPLSVDVNCGVIFYDAFTTGFSYRSGDSFISFVNLKLMDKLYLSYSFDLTHSNLSPFSSGTHELMINYRTKITSAHKNLVCPTYHQYR